MKKMQLSIFKNLPTLETERLILKKITKTYLDDVYEYRSDPNVSRYLLWSPEKDKQSTLFYLEYLEELYGKGKFYDFGIFLKENGKMIGTVGFTTIDLNKNSASVGYVLNSKYWGQGIALEALTKIINFGFNELLFDKLFAKFAEDNIASKRVLEKSGFKYLNYEKKSLLLKNKMQKIAVYVLEKNYT